MAVKWNYLARNVADDSDKPAVPEREMTVLDPDELGRLIDGALAQAERPDMTAQQARAARQWAVLWQTAVYSGCRESELLALFWSDLDLERGTLTVRRNLVAVKDQVPRFGEPKSRTSRRTIALPAEAVEALRAHKARQVEERLAAVEWVDNNLVFCTHLGTPLIRRNVLRAFKQALARADLPGSIRFHDLRHAHATLMLRAGVPLKIASGRLGHSGIGITADLYQHVASDMDLEAAERVASAMRGGQSIQAKTKTVPRGRKAVP
jgi:integrase